MLTATNRLTTAITATDPIFAALRQKEFGRLDENRLAYLDYTGSALPAARQLQAHTELLDRGVYGNPHADNEPSRRSTQALDAGRALLLAHLEADAAEYVVCFSANATGAVKLVAESYPFTRESGYVLSADNHNSLNGVREYARRAGARIAYVPLDAQLRLDGSSDVLGRFRAARGPRLFAFPAQSNFSGVRHPLELIETAQDAGFEVLVDAAAFLPSCGLSLRAHRPEFVVLSFYKLFGVPTGLGALVARRDALARLRRPWFSGGTIEYVSVQNDVHSLLPAAGGFEDGTPHFLGAAALASGFDLLAEVGMARLSAHIGGLTNELLVALRCITYRDGAPAAQIYGPTGSAGRGGTVAFNVLDRHGRVVPYWVVEERARARGVAVRGGCFCNPGAAEAAFGFDGESAARCLRVASEGGFTIPQFAECMTRDAGVAVGAVRASLGLANNDADVRRAVEVVESFVQ
ncbi:MAG TPA: aminotransferase class V-fold PLP-dependent enzyme [Gemmatimonadaceae bacterium]|jgi:selenocysteine lyase/cysteine desulfurase